MTNKRKVKGDKDTSKVWTVSEVAERLRVHPNTIRDLLASGAMKGFRIRSAGRWRISSESLFEFETRNYERK